ncbi:O-methyltransferase [Enemella sp. A6]|uniref:O-methyltransferase n=1 Tax=Enemella sp. A6 TaxID=3440152 RepID=UPI003EBE0B05
MTTPLDTPEIVTRALKHSLKQGYLQVTRSETGRLLATLAAASAGTIAECGSGCGVGAAWLRTGAPDSTKVVTAEENPDLAQGVQELFADDAIDVINADWARLGTHGPFSLVFMDGEIAAEVGIDDVLALVDRGGIIVLDDFVPAGSWPPMVDGRVDTLRQAWLGDDRLTSTEVRVADDAAVLICVRS